MALTVCVARLDIMSNPELWVVKGLEVVAEVPVRRGKNFRRARPSNPDAAVESQPSSVTILSHQNVANRTTVIV